MSTLSNVVIGSTTTRYRRHLYLKNNPTLILLGIPQQRKKETSVPWGHACLATNIDTKRINLTELICGIDFQWTTQKRQRVIRDLANAIIHEAVEWPGRVTWVGFGIYVWNTPIVMEVMRIVHEECPWIRFVLGGPSVTFGYEELQPQIAVPHTAIRGYAEQALPKVVLGESGEKGVYRSDEPVGSDLCDLDLTKTKSSILLHPEEHVGRGGFARLETSRGCLFRCTFCHNTFAGRGHHKLVHAWPLEVVLESIRLLIANGAREFNIPDPVFTANRNWKAILHEFIRLEFKGKITLQCHFDQLPDEFLDLCEQLNVQLEFGVQTADPAEAVIVGRKVVRSRITRRIRDLQRRGIHFTVSLIYGLPSQTYQSFLETVQFLVGLGIPVIEVFPLGLYPGSVLSRTKNQWAYRTAGSDGLHHVLGSASASEQDIQQMAKVASWLELNKGRYSSRVPWWVGFRQLDPEIQQLKQAA